MRNSRGFGFFILLLVYIAAAFVGFAVFLVTGTWGFYIRLFAADAAATLFVWLIGLLLKNPSVYDPYWSVAPIVMLILGEAYLGVFNTGVLLIDAVVVLWGARLTAHWATTFRSLRVQDWRYSQLKDENPRLWLIVNLMGINIFPTVVVFLALAPAFQFVLNFRSLNLAAVLGALVCLTAAALQLISDTQMRRFRRNRENAGRVMRLGLWKYSRHPNYLGEVLMWWGICVMAFSSTGASLWYAVGALVNTLMFVFVSIPMMERRQLGNKAEYAAYKAETGMLFPKLWGSGVSKAAAPRR